MDKSQAVIEFLLGLDGQTSGCDQIKNNALFFNFLTVNDNDKQFLTVANDKSLNRTYLDGSVLKRFTFTIVDYRSIAYQAVVKQAGYLDKNENLVEYLDVQGIIDWITEQSHQKHYPNFGNTCIIEDMRTLTDNPNLNGVDTSIQPTLAKYSMSIQIDYIDTETKFWNN